MEKKPCTFFADFAIEKRKEKRGYKIAQRFQEEFNKFSDSCVDENYFIKNYGFQLKRAVSLKTGEPYKYIKMIAYYPMFGIEISKNYNY